MSQQMPMYPNSAMSQGYGSPPPLYQMPMARPQDNRSPYANYGYPSQPYMNSRGPDPREGYVAEQNSMIQKLLDELNNKYEDDLENQNNDLLQKIEKIERENQKLAHGIDSDEEAPPYSRNRFKNNDIEYEDQKIVSDAVDRAIRQYEYAKAKEDAEIEEKRRAEEERLRRMIPKPSPEEILFSPITDDEIFHYATSLPPVSKPFQPYGGPKIRGHDQLDDNMNMRTGFQPNAQDAFEGLVGPKEIKDPQTTKADIKNLISNKVMKSDILQNFISNKPNKTADEIRKEPLNDQNEDYEMAKMMKQQEALKKQDDELLKKLKSENGYFDANKGKGLNIHFLMKNIKPKKES